MKKLALFIVITGLILTGCKTQQKATTENYDDVYYSKPKLAQSGNKAAGSSQDLSAPKYVTSPDSTSSVKSGSASSKEDNSDYSYSARLKRFHDPVGKLGYYDNYYTTSQNSDSTSGNTTINIYGGSGYDPFFSPGFSIGFGYGGWGYGGWGYGWGYPYSWYYPYYYWGPPCYYCDYWGWGHYPYWDNGIGNNYYGRRTRVGEHNGTGNRNLRSLGSSSVSNQARTTTGTASGREKSPLNQPYSRTTEAPRSIAGNGGKNANPVPRESINPNPQPVPKRTPADQQRYNYKRSNVQKISPNPRTINKNTQVQRAVPRYAKPEYSAPARTGQAQVYSSPAYRQPKSSQEYISPRNQDIQKSGNNNAIRQGSGPSNNARRYIPGNNSRTYSPSSNGSRNTYMGPTRTYTPGNSAPSRTNNYSAPSRSSGGGSYSAPSRSSGNSGGGNNSSGSSGGGRRK